MEVEKPLNCFRWHPQDQEVPWRWKAFNKLYCCSGVLMIEDSASDSPTILVIMSFGFAIVPCALLSYLALVLTLLTRMGMKVTLEVIFLGGEGVLFPFVLEGASGVGDTVWLSFKGTLSHFGCMLTTVKSLRADKCLLRFLIWSFVPHESEGSMITTGSETISHKHITLLSSSVGNNGTISDISIWTESEEDF
ncbi:uncharacterized protein BJ212DRAFT_1304385 [Suillus subaureus]|uniref:Uncharacterized protein n=1 Tax=Suillus subaureus TaxID=48587 RepID=A0A9P7DVF4_9AGAM|nr:uncharacterized protein BJ212DRAFT_1304385 [Suillus subaureus]KAG1804168.1 hypothetical protein BJ212DRAFT_1304385 [Suillus subaureus]